MTRNIYALLVGIDNYPEGVPSLQGCVNDINAIESYLTTRINSQKYQFYPKKLLNQSATRQAIIDGFENHLCQAGSEDIAFFYYSGHGSNETAPPEFFQFEPDRQIETIVCYDSRLEGGKDLADKEMSYLISKVAKKNPQIILIMDCCHSGSGTRDTVPQRGVRHASANQRPRKMEDFIFSLNELQSVASSSTAQTPGNNLSGWNLPGGRHILLAGCQDNELAKEYSRDGQRRGAFSYFLVNTLEQTNGSLTYRELFKRANALIRSRVQDQSPQLEATHLDDLKLPFLGFPEEAAIAQQEPFFTLSCDANQQWFIDGGAVHGLPQLSSEPIRLALYPQGSSAKQMQQLSAALGEVEITQVLPQKSFIQFRKEPANLTTDMVLNAVITSLPLPPLGVFLEGDENALHLVRDELATVGVGGQPSLYVREVEAEANFRLLARNRQYLITKPEDDRPLVEQIDGYTQPNALKAIKRLEHMARWVTTVELSTPANNRIPADAVEMHLYQDGEEILEPQFRLEYQYRNGTWHNPTFQVKLVNKTEQRLYCTLLDLTEEYSIKAHFFGSGGTWLEPESEAWATVFSAGTLKQGIPASVPDYLWKQGITEYQDILKLIVSTAEFDPTLLSQEKLDKPTTRSVSRNVTRNGTLNRLMNRVTHRDLGDDGAEEVDEWVTSQVTIITVRPQDAALIQKDTPILLGTGITLQAHPHLEATAQLSTVSQATRDVGTQVLPPILQENTRPFQFTASRGADPGLSVLELTVKQPEALQTVTRNTPLRLTVEQPLAENEVVLPVAYDGEFFLPLGYGITKDSKTEIVIEQLPEPVTQGKRSLTGSVRIFFQKLISEQLGREFSYPLLAALDIHQPEVPILDPTLVRQRVKQAQKIVLYIHGIIGDTRSMVPSVRSAKVSINGQERALTEIYDLVLTFDYENLNTPVATIAEQLRDRLAAVGLSAGHDKVLHIVAHSMGGLVSRSFIEQKGGNQVVQHLIMLGTPNGGSPWATVQDWALATLTFALNNLLSMAPPPKLLGKLVGVLEKVDITLDEMRPDSEFLNSLNASPDPQVPYTVVAGNTSIIDTSFPVTRNRVQALVAKLNQVGRRIIEFPFFGDPNDIAVAVHNIKKVPRNRTYPTLFYDVGCNHLVYFTSPIGLKTLAEAVNGTGIVDDQLLNPSQKHF